MSASIVLESSTLAKPVLDDDMILGDAVNIFGAKNRDVIIFRSLLVTCRLGVFCMRIYVSLSHYKMSLIN